MPCVQPFSFQQEPTSQIALHRNSSVYGGRYWTNPAVVEKISAAMGQPVAEGAQPEGEEAIEGGEEEEEEDEEPNVHSAASTGGPGS